MSHTRSNFSTQTKRDAYKRARGLCECHLLAKRKIKGFSRGGCGQRLSDGNTFYEHIDPDQLSGHNDIENCAVLVKTCWRLKTDTFDLPTIAKNNRMRDRAHGIKNPRTIRGWRRFSREIVYADRNR